MTTGRSAITGSRQVAAHRRRRQALPAARWRAPWKRAAIVVDTADTVAEGIRKVEAAPPAFAVVDLRLEDGNGLDVDRAGPQAPPGFARGGADRLRQHRHRRDRGEARRGRLSRQARRRRRHPLRAHPRAGRARRCRRKIRCRPTASAGSTSSGSTSSATATSRRPRAGSTCTAARCSASSPSAPRARLSR